VPSVVWLAQAKFGFLKDAFTFGAPPHDGIAFGWDRITALLADVDSIREVITFPCFPHCRWRGGNQSGPQSGYTKPAAIVRS
jgi:hypothetical protein